MQNCSICAANIQVLGIEQLPTSESEVKQAYRDGAKVWHPDRFQGDPRLAKKAEAQFKRVLNAYQQLTEHARTHGNYGAESHEANPTRSQPQECPRQKSSVSPSQLERFLSAIKRRTDGQRFFDESRLPPEIAQATKKVLLDANRILGVVDISMKAGTMREFVMFFDGGIALSQVAYGTKRVTDYNKVADFEMRKLGFFDRVGARSSSTFGIWILGQRIDEMLNDVEVGHFYNLLEDIKFVVHNPHG